MNYELNITYSIKIIQGILYRLILMKISILNGKFPIRSNHFLIKVVDGVKEVEPFHVYSTINQKEIHCLFTVDAFSDFIGNVDINFGFIDEIINGFEEIPINISISPLPSDLSSLTYIDADNTWLNSL